MVLVLPIHAFEEAIIETSKSHNLFIKYPNNTYFNALKMGIRPIKYLILLITVTSANS
jgi:hypothetical protein